MKKKKIQQVTSFQPNIKRRWRKSNKMQRRRNQSQMKDGLPDQRRLEQNEEAEDDGFSL